MTSILSANATVPPLVRHAPLRRNELTTGAMGASSQVLAVPPDHMAFSGAALDALRGRQSANAPNNPLTSASASDTDMFSATASTINTLTDDDRALLLVVTGWRAPDGPVTGPGLQASRSSPFIPLLAGVIADQRKSGLLTGQMTADSFTQMVDAIDRNLKPDLQFSKSQINAGLQLIAQRGVSQHV